MTAFVPAQRPGLRLALAFAARELRGGVSGFRVFLACLALGVAAIAGIGGLSAALSDGLKAEGRNILGGDLAFTLTQQEATPQERARLAALGAVSEMARMRAMVRGGEGEATMSELRAVDAAYPLAGSVTVDGADGLADALAERDGVHGLAADPALLDRLGIAPGDRVRIGNGTYELRATIASASDALAGGIGFGPNVLLSHEAMRATGLIQPGSLVTWTYRVALPAMVSDDELDRIAASVTDAFPDAGWRVRTRANASPQLERNVARFTQFLTLVGLTALVVGGVGVANAVAGFVDRKRESIAALKCLGATGGFVVGMHLLQVLALGLLAVGIGLAIGMALPYAAVWGLGDLLPIAIDARPDPLTLALAAAYGLLTALAFALWPLGRAHDVPVSALFREQVERSHARPRLRYLIWAGTAIAVLVGLAIITAYERRIALAFVIASTCAFLVLRVVAWAIMALARRSPRPRRTEWRLALVNLHRPGALTPSVVISLGLGLTLLVTLTLIDGSIRRQLTEALPERAPSFFFLDVPSSEAERFDAFLKERVPGGEIERVPMLRGTVKSLRGIAASDYPAPPQAEWVLRGDRGITFASAPPEGSAVVEGDWWPADHDGPPLVSFEAELAGDLGLAIGDTIEVNVLGRPVTATIANLRKVEWESLGINFVMVFSPDTFRGAPFNYLATLGYDDTNGEAGRGLVRDVADAFPEVTAIRVKEALETVDALMRDLAAGIRAASGITLVASVLVLAGALAAGHRHRIYDAVILKTLGATRRRLLAAFSLEYLLLGLVTALFGVLAGTAAAWAIVTHMMRFAFLFDAAGAVTVAAAALVLTVTLGLAGTWRVLGEKPARHLRNL